MQWPTPDENCTAYISGGCILPASPLVNTFVAHLFKERNMSTIITKFAVASDKMIAELLYLTRTWQEEQPGIVLEGQYTKKILVNSMNSFSSQWFIVYAGEEPAGFAFLSEGGARPAFLEGKRAIQLEAFAVLKAYAGRGADASLLDKCLSVYKGRELMWAPLSVAPDFLEAKGFVKANGYLVKEGW